MQNDNFKTTVYAQNLRNLKNRKIVKKKTLPDVVDLRIL